VMLLNSPAPVTKITFQMNERFANANGVWSITSISLKMKNDILNWGRPWPLPFKTPIVLDAKTPEWSQVLDGTVAFDEIVVISNLSNAAEMINGTEVCEMTVTDIHGVKNSFMIRAGHDTAEWSYDRHDSIERVKHSKPSVALSKRQLDPDGNPFLAHHYGSAFKFSVPTFIKSISMRSRVLDEKYPSCEYTVYSIVLR
jgi:hypothetical protein